MSLHGYVVDASVALKWFLSEESEPDVGLAEDLVGNCQLLTTSLCAFEVGNTLSRISPDQPDRVSEALGELGEICGVPVELTAADFHRCAELVGDHSLTFYDASYVAIAERLGRKVISADRDLLDPGLAVDMATALNAA